MAIESLLRSCFTSNHSLRSTDHPIHLSQKNETSLHSILLLSLSITKTLSFLEFRSNFAVLYALISWRLERLAFTLIVESRYLDNPLKTLLQEQYPRLSFQVLAHYIWRCSTRNGDLQLLCIFIASFRTDLLSSSSFPSGITFNSYSSRRDNKNCIGPRIYSISYPIIWLQSYPSYPSRFLRTFFLTSTTTSSAPR